MGHALMENRSGLVVDTTTTTATGTAEREAAAAMVGNLPAGQRITVGGDKLFDTQDFVAEMRRLGVTPHVAQTPMAAAPRSMAALRAIPVMRSASARASASRKCSAGSRRSEALRKTRHRGTARVGWMFTFTAAAYNLVRIPKLLAGAA